LQESELQESELQESAGAIRGLDRTGETVQRGISLVSARCPRDTKMLPPPHPKDAAAEMTIDPCRRGA
jgi:hypothetical protein